MSDEKKKNPAFEFKDLPRTGKAMRIVLDSAKDIASGKNDYGTWHLWPVKVENALVWQGKKPNKKAVENYTGEAICFPTQALHERFLELTNGIEGVAVLVSKETKDGKNGKELTSYHAIKDGQATEQAPAVTKAEALTPSELLLVKDAKELINGGFGIDEDTFVATSQSSSYGGKISIDRAKKLYKML